MSFSSNAFGVEAFSNTSFELIEPTSIWSPIDVTPAVWTDTADESTDWTDTPLPTTIWTDV